MGEENQNESEKIKPRSSKNGEKRDGVQATKGSGRCLRQRTAAVRQSSFNSREDSAAGFPENDGSEHCQ